jgi:hypothetical protein
MRHLALCLLLLAVCGCCIGQQIEQQMHEEIGEGVDAGVRLMLAIEAFRLGSGRWPVSPNELRTSPLVDLAVRFDAYENLRFEPQPDGRLVVRFDRWTGRGESPVSANGVGELPPPDVWSTTRPTPTPPAAEGSP